MAADADGGNVGASGKKKKKAARLRVDPKHRDHFEKELLLYNREMILLQNFCILNYTGAWGRLDFQREGRGES